MYATIEQGKYGNHKKPIYLNLCFKKGSSAGSGIMAGLKCDGTDTTLIFSEKGAELYLGASSSDTKCEAPITTTTTTATTTTTMATGNGFGSSPNVLFVFVLAGFCVFPISL